MTDKQSMSTLEVLERARALIEKPENWTKRRLHTYGDHPSHCACGAIERAIDDLTGCVPSLDACTMDGFKSWADLSDFNDAPERTHPEVLAAFTRAIEAEKAKAGR